LKILAFAASNSKHSINRKLANYVADLHPSAQVEKLDINDYEMPIYSTEREAELGQPLLAKQFYAKITQADALIISFAEYNGSYSAAYKNLFDWTSRIEQKLFQNKPTIYLATSPGAGGAAAVLAAASNSASHFAADLKASISVPSFYKNFDTDNNQLLNPALKEQLQQAVSVLI